MEKMGKWDGQQDTEGREGSLAETGREEDAHSRTEQPCQLPELVQV